jgi:hypothetical protein
VEQHGSLRRQREGCAITEVIPSAFDTARYISAGAERISKIQGCCQSEAPETRVNRGGYKLPSWAEEGARRWGRRQRVTDSEERCREVVQH